MSSRQGQKSMKQQEILQEQIQALGEGGKRVESAVAQLLDSQAGIGDTILKGLISRTRIVEQQQSIQNLEGDLISALHHEAVVSKTDDNQAPLVSIQREEYLQQIFLDRLRYRDMEDREGRIAEPFEKTFRWIFDDDNSTSNSWSNFKNWLKSESKLYWITGKAGSGKSTLMKFISQTNTGQDGPSATRNISQQTSRRCYQYLYQWAGNLRLVFATFYFWNSGVALQVSQRGLLLSLLYQILQQTPDIIATISPKRWESLCLFNKDLQEWNNAELQGILRSAIKENCKNMKICLFIDGLDEFEGNQQDLISLITDVIANSNVKICVASRPWVEFQDAFNHKPTLLLQDLTYPDIKHFVITNLQRDINYDQLRRREKMYADQLVENIVTKSSGVFLWVNLVVKSLLAGMNNGDRVIDLQKRLDLLPPDLERLYDKILGSLDPFYLEHAAQLFKMVQESPYPPPLLILLYADEVDLTSAISQPVKAITYDEESIMLDTMRRRLNSRCRGLLEVSTESHNDSEHTVQYLHRTVKDYISSERAQKTLQIPTTSSFNPHQSLCAGNLAHLKTFDDSRILVPGTPFWDSIERCLYSAAQLQSDSPASTMSLLDELRQVGNRIAVQRHEHCPSEENLDSIIANDTAGCLSVGGELELDFALKHKLRRCFRNNLPDFGSDLLSLTVYYGIVEYIRAQAISQTAIASPLLLDAIQSFYIHKKPRSQLQMIECLLAKGADPNFPVVKLRRQISETVWTGTLSLIMGDNHGQEAIGAAWHEVVKLMIQYGAKAEEQYLCKYDPFVVVVDTARERKILLDPSTIRLSKVYGILRKDSMRLSKALKLGGDFNISIKDLPALEHVNVQDALKKLRLYSQVQEFRQQYDTGILSHLFNPWKRK